MKFWVDDVRPAPEGYLLCPSVDFTKEMIEYCELCLKNEEDERVIKQYTVEIIDIDHDAGDYVSEGGDYIEILNWLEETGRNYPIRIHSMNPVGVANMRRIIERNGWTEVK